MASVTPRASGFWEDDQRMSYFNDVEAADGEQGEEIFDELDDRTPLDKTIDRIGMGSYQWTLLSLCGFGWMADNMWIQAVAIILPRVQQHFAVSDAYIGTLSSSMFAGMMFGAVGWGSCSDMLGRSTAFNATLFFTSLFGFLASWVSSFRGLCVALFFLGSAVGGSMPTDGTLLLEHVPKGKQYLVTALSVFFSFGSVLGAVVGLIVVPKYSCKPGAECDVQNDNKGWQYMLAVLGTITLVMFLARIVFFRLHESPRYLVHAGRHQEALVSLQLISRFNGDEMQFDLEDVDDRPRPAPSPPRTPEGGDAGERAPFLGTRNAETIFDADATANMAGSNNHEVLRSGDATKDYNSTSESSNELGSHAYVTPVSEIPPRGASVPTKVDDDDLPPARPRPPRSRPSERPSMRARSSSVVSYEIQKRAGILPRWIRRPLLAWVDRITMVLAPEWLRTTVLMWGVWLCMALAYTMFNVYLPKLLETVGGPELQTEKSLEASLWDVVIFTLGGTPGALLGAYMIETRLGRRGSLLSTTLITAFFSVVFAQVNSPFAVRVSSAAISLSSTTMYAVLYGWTPEIFGTKIRGTACGIASALSRIGGMIAPLLGGALLIINRAFPVYASVGVYLGAALFVALLHETAGEEKGGGGFVH